MHTRSQPAGFELRFDSLFIAGRGLAFPCDADGRVDLDALSDRARASYLKARSAVGVDYGTPAVQRRMAPDDRH